MSLIAYITGFIIGAALMLVLMAQRERRIWREHTERLRSRSEAIRAVETARATVRVPPMADTTYDCDEHFYMPEGCPNCGKRTRTHGVAEVRHETEARQTPTDPVPKGGDAPAG